MMALETEVILTQVLTTLMTAKTLEEAQKKLKILVPKEKLAEIEKLVAELAEQ